MGLPPRLQYFGYAAGWSAVRALPEPWARAAFNGGAAVAARKGGNGVRRLRANLARVLGEHASPDHLDRVTAAGVASYARYWREVFRLSVTPYDDIVAGTTMANEGLMRECYAAGKGVVMVLPHQGNWDYAGVWATLTGMPFTTVAERVEPAALFDRFVAMREEIGMEVVPLTGGMASPFELLEARLRAGGMLCLLGDRDLTARGVEVDFFGAATRFPSGPAALALRTGAALLPVTLSNRPDGWDLRTHDRVLAPSAEPGVTDEAAAVAAMTQQVARAFEVGIAEHPQDWHMLQRLWLDDLAPGDPRRRRAGTDAGEPA
ncbi:MAG TPA: phosphatidylinositol mannoside acyltransferase [Mycobacteriales bacterium]|nr:phosphatidylinositol mannoside acyltransferase [Mycobacteriales bacterium]